MSRAVQALPVGIPGDGEMQGSAKLEFGERRKALLVVLLLVLVIAAAVVATLSGTYDLSVLEVLETFRVRLPWVADARVDRVHDTIVWQIRLPRVLVGVLVGFGLATAGAVYQGTFRNPLVEPFILGVSAGASFGASLAILYPGLFLNLQVGAFGFGLVAVSIVYFSSRIHGQNSPVNLILAGVIVSSLFQALVSILKYSSDDAALRAIVFWIMGGLYFAGWNDIAYLFPVVVVTIATIWVLGWRLNVLSMGDDEARSLGIHPGRLRLVLILLATLMTGIVVASVGVIAWVGLMMPHAARMMLGPDHRFVIPGAALLGAAYLLLCDTLARTLIGTEIPLSIITSILGAPYLLYLLRSRGRAVFGG